MFFQNDNTGNPIRTRSKGNFPQSVKKACKHLEDNTNNHRKQQNAISYNRD